MSNSSQYHLMRVNIDESMNGADSSLAYKPAFNYMNSTGEIVHTHHLADHIGQLLMNESCSDMTLIVEDIRFPVHRIILAARSNYFCAMLYGGLRESSSSEVCLVDTPVQAFKVLLKYIYCGKIQLESMNFDLVIDVLGLVHKYGFLELEMALSDYLKSILNQRSVCVIYSAAHLYSMTSLITTCLDFFDTYAAETLTTPGFLQLSASAVIQLIGRNSFCAPEIDIFNAVKRWIKAHPDEANRHADVLSNVRLYLIKIEDLLSVVRPSSLIDPNVLLDALTDQNKKRSSDFVYRGFLMPNVNVASVSLNAKVLTGDNLSELLTPQAKYHLPSCEKFSRHTIGAHDPGIIVELGRCFIINHIQLSLFDREQRMYSYYVEVSVDHNDWIRVADFTKYLCRARQKIFFNERVVKYIRVVGTYNSNNIQGTFNLTRLEALYSTESFEIDPETTLLIPQYNVATIPNNAIVVEGVSRSRNALLNGETKNYDWDNGYTCHELGSSSIIVQLPQPYLIGSMRLLLWDCDDRTYSFYIEVSYDRINWTKVVEVEHKRSWQTLYFDRIPVVFIKIVGTYNSANEVFHCVHFECPAVLSTVEGERCEITQDSSDSKDEEKLSDTKSSNTDNCPSIDALLEFNDCFQPSSSNFAIPAPADDVSESSDNNKSSVVVDMENLSLRDDILVQPDLPSCSNFCEKNV